MALDVEAIRAWRKAHAWEVSLFEERLRKPMAEAVFHARETRLEETRDEYEYLSIEYDSEWIVEADQVADPLELANFVLQSLIYIDALMKEVGRKP